MMELKPIETQYRGYRFRSRLEARWAVFFDALRIPYVYEPEGYELAGERYLPDFWLPEQQCFVEIKPARPDERECRLAGLLAETSGFRTFIFFSLDSPPPDSHSDCDSAWLTWLPYVHDGDYWWCECTTCHALDIQYCGRSDRMPCKKSGQCPRSEHGDKGYTYDTPRLRLAYEAARSARFEHGENGDVAFAARLAMLQLESR